MQVRMPEDEGDGSRDTEPVEEAQTEPVETSGPEDVTTEPAVHAPGEERARDRPRRMTDREAHNWAVAAHLSWLVTVVGIPPPIGPLVVWLIKKDEHAFVDDQGKEALNFQLSILVYAVVGAIGAVIFGIVTLGIGFLAVIPVVILFLLLAFILPVIAAIKASEGERYRYPLTLRLIS